MTTFACIVLAAITFVLALANVRGTAFLRAARRREGEYRALAVTWETAAHGLEESLEASQNALKRCQTVIADMQGVMAEQGRIMERQAALLPFA